MTIAELIQEFEAEAQDDAARARTRALGQTGVDPAHEVDVARQAGDASRVRSGRDLWMADRGSLRVHR